MQKIFDFILKSSADAQKTSLTIKGAGIAAIPTIVLVAHLANIQLQNEQLTQVVDGLANAVLYIGYAISACVFLYGLLRKIVLTMLGENQALNQ